MKGRRNLCIAILLTISPLVVSESQWGYTGKSGPDYWHERFNECAGKKQSPIDIKAEETMYDPSLRDFAIWYDPPKQDSNFTVKNNGHTLQVDLQGDFYVSNGGLKHVYKAAQFHFHWGSQVHHGSEHLMEGKASPIELHLVTYDSETYEDIYQAASETNGLAVLGTMFEISKEDNPVFESIVRAIEFIRDPRPKRGIRLPVDSVSIRSILPHDISRYFRYQGSLTTPHCYESVIWTVFQQKQTISIAQLNQFRTLLQFGHRHHKETGSAPKVVTVEKPSRHRRSASRRHGHRNLGKRERDVLVELGIKGNYDEEEAFLKQAARADSQMYEELGMMSDQPADPSHNQIDKHSPEETKMHAPVIVNNYRPVQPLHGRVVYRSFKLGEPPIGEARSQPQRVSYNTVNGEAGSKQPCDGAAGVWASMLLLMASLLLTVVLVL